MNWDLATPKQVRNIYTEVSATEESLKNDVQHLISWIRIHEKNDSDHGSNHEVIDSHQHDFVHKVGRLISRRDLEAPKRPFIFSIFKSFKM